MCGTSGNQGAVKKNKASKEIDNDPEGLFQKKKKKVREGFSEEVAFEQNLKIVKAGAMYREKSIPDSEDSKCKGPKVGMCLAFLVQGTERRSA